MKKSQGLSLSTVVIAALALLVLIILSVIFVGRMANVSDKSKNCEQRGGICYNIEDGATCKQHGDFLVEHGDAECQKDGNNGKLKDESKICCIRVG